MPSITTLNSHASSLWREYFTVVETLREYAVWRHEEDGQRHAAGSNRPPRFVAVVADQAAFEGFQQRAVALAILNTKWPIQTFDEVWGWGRVQVNSATHARRLQAGLPVTLGEVDRPEDAAGVLAALEAAGHQAVVADGQLVVTPGPAGLTARQGGGRAFRLRAWAEDGTLLHDKLSVGVVVCRGVQRGIEDGSGRSRKTRADALVQVASWNGVTLYQVK